MDESKRFSCCICGEKPPVIYACDETMEFYCDEHFKDVHCDEYHGEGCMTMVWQ